MSEIRLECVNRDGSFVGSLPGAILKSVTWELNGPGQLEYTMSQADRDSDVIIINQNETQLYVDDVLMFWGFNHKVSQTPKDLQFIVPGLLQYFNYRFITNTSLQYTSMDQLDLVAQFIADMQHYSGQNFNIATSSYSPSGVTRSRWYKREEHKNALDILQEFPKVTDAVGNATGFDFDFTYNLPGQRMFTPYYPNKGQHRTEPVLEWGRNITDFTVNEDGSQMANRVYMTGGSNGDIKFENEYRDAASADGPYGEWQSIVSDPGENDVGVLLERAQREVARRKVPVLVPDLTCIEVPDTLLGVLTTGDWVPVEIDCGRTQINSSFRIQTIKWLPGPGNLTLTLGLA